MIPSSYRICSGDCQLPTARQLRQFHDPAVCTRYYQINTCRERHSAAQRSGQWVRVLVLYCTTCADGEEDKRKNLYLLWVWVWVGTLSMVEIVPSGAFASSLAAARRGPTESQAVPNRQPRLSEPHKPQVEDWLLRTSSSPHTVICCSYSSATGTSAEQHISFVLSCSVTFACSWLFPREWPMY